MFRPACVSILIVLSLCLLLVFPKRVLEAAPVVPAYSRLEATEEAPHREGGWLLWRELNCDACHLEGPTAVSDKFVRPAPDLTEVVGRVRLEHLRQMIADPAASKPGSKMPNVWHAVTDKTRAEDVEAIIHYLATLATERLSQQAAPLGARKRGETLYHKVGCVACHDPRQPDAPALGDSVPHGDLESKYTLPSLARFLLNPLAARPAGRMPSLSLSQREAEDVAAFLLPSIPEQAGIAVARYEGNWSELPDFDEITASRTGEAETFSATVFGDGDNFGLRFRARLSLPATGEYTFHLSSDDGSRLRINGQVVVNNDGVHGMQGRSGQATLSAGVHDLELDYFEAQGGAELKLELEGPAIARQDAHLFVDRSPPAGLASLETLTPNQELAERGRQVFTARGCANCHAVGAAHGDRPHPGKETVAQEATPQDGQTARRGPGWSDLSATKGCLAESPSGQAVDYRLSAEQRRALRTFVDADGVPGDLADDATVIQHTMLQLNCVACHARDGLGGVTEERSAWFQTTQPEMGDEGRLPPPLDGVGGKLQADWLAGLLRDGANDRPYMLTRMPKFGEANAGHLAKLLEQTDRLEPLADIALERAEAKQAGWRMVGEKGFGCIKCHTFGQYAATGVQAIDMTIMTRRLRPEWFHRYLQNPQLFRRGTRMPSAWPTSGPSLLSDILEGDSQKQIAAVWDYLQDGRRARTPFGLQTDSLLLIPDEEAIIYRNFIAGAGPRAIAVGYPEGVHVAYDAQQGRLALMWQGEFINAQRHWTGRGQGFEPPAGEPVVTFPDGPDLALLASPDASWPAAVADYRFLGYELSSDQRPTFLARYGSVVVSDFPNPIELANITALGRTIRLKSADAQSNNDASGRGAGDGSRYVRVAAGQQILAGDQPDQWRVDGTLSVNIIVPNGITPWIRTQGGKQELLVPVPDERLPFEIQLQYQW